MKYVQWVLLVPNWYAGRPEWIRWVLFVPLAAMGAFLGLFLFVVLRVDEEVWSKVVSG